MSDVPGIVDALKRALRAHRITYNVVAEALDMSEANVKRMFKSQSVTLGRVEQICRLMDMDLPDLFQMYDASRQRLKQLTVEQEKELVNDTRLLMIAVAVRNHFTFEEILDHHHIGEMDVIRCLAKLDKLKIIDLLPNNKIKLRIDENFSWIPHGPIESFYEKTIQKEFMTGRFPSNSRLFSFGLLSERSIAVLNTKLRALAHEFIELSKQDRKLPLELRHSAGMLTGIRQWEFSVLAPYIKPPKNT